MTKKGKVFIVLILIAVALTTALLILNPISERRRNAKTLLKSISKTEKLESILLVSNFRYIFEQNGKTNETVTQGIYSSVDNRKNVMIKGEITVTSDLNPANNFSTNFDLIKKSDSVYEKKGTQYIPSGISAEEFSKMTEEFKIYKFKLKEVKDIKKTVSIDRSQVIYEVSLKKLPDKLMKDYVESINNATGEEFTVKDVKILSCSLVSNVSGSMLRSQQLRISIEVRSKTNVIRIGFISEINITDDKAQIEKLFNGQEEF